MKPYAAQLAEREKLYRKILRRNVLWFLRPDTIEIYNRMKLRINCLRQNAAGTLPGGVVCAGYAADCFLGALGYFTIARMSPIIAASVKRKKMLLNTVASQLQGDRAALTLTPK